jgi:hypothetical protein
MGSPQNVSLAVTRRHSRGIVPQHIILEYPIQLLPPSTTLLRKALSRPPVSSLPPPCVPPSPHPPTPRIRPKRPLRAGSRIHRATRLCRRNASKATPVTTSSSPHQLHLGASLYIVLLLDTDSIGSIGKTCLHEIEKPQWQGKS